MAGKGKGKEVGGQISTLAGSEQREGNRPSPNRIEVVGRDREKGMGGEGGGGEGEPAWEGMA